MGALVRDVDAMEQFGGQLSKVEPSILYTPQNPPLGLPSSNTVVLIVHIPKSSQAPHAFSESGAYHFYKRTNQGNQPMSYAEINDAFTFRNLLLAKLRLLDVQLTDVERRLQYITIASPEGEREGRKKWNWRKKERKNLTYPAIGLDYGLLDIVVGDLYPVIHNDSELLGKIELLKVGCASINGVVAQLRMAMQFVPLSKLEDDFNAEIRDRGHRLSQVIQVVREILASRYDMSATR